MIKLENYEVMGWEHAIRGMRNPMNSWDRSDTFGCVCDTPIFTLCGECIFNEDDERCTRRDEPIVIGKNDHELMMKLAKGGSVHAKYRRMITVYVDITAPLYWWKEFDTYKVGTVANSCSTMHKIHEKEFTLEDFSCEHLLTVQDDPDCYILCGGLKFDPMDDLYRTIKLLNKCREKYLETINCGRASGKTEYQTELAKHYWWQMIQLLPSSYNQKRTVMLNYEVLANIYESRRNHKLDEWNDMCEWIESLPYSEIIIGKEEEE